MCRLAPIAVLLCALGCAEDRIEFLEIRRIEERLTAADIELLERIAKQVNGGRLPAASPHFLPVPKWDRSRPATVATLAREELERLRETIRLEHFLSGIGREARLRHAVDKERMTMEQYAGVLRAVGMAVQRAKVDPARDLARYIDNGRVALKALSERDDSFASLDPDRQVDALEQATWITRVDRAERLDRIPGENVALVRGAMERLEAILPQQFLSDPLAEVADPLRDYGVPFKERPDSGFDSELMWSRSDERAIIGGRRVATGLNDIL